MLLGKQIVLGVTGSIAAYKAATICSLLCQNGAQVRVVMTKAATKFISPLTFQTLSQHAVVVDTFEEDSQTAGITHIELASFAEIFLIAPASANTLGVLAHGLASDMLSNVFLATRAKVVVAPAMNSNMLLNPAVQANIDILMRRGVNFIQPAIGTLACGVTGQGRLPEPEDIIQYLEAMCINDLAEESLALSEPPPVLPLANRSVLISAGSTIERIDPVRYITNDSSGKMGIALAQVASEMGANVTLIAGKIQVPVPGNVFQVKFIESAREMREEVLSVFDDMDVIIMAAAVADYRPVKQAQTKLKKSDHADNLVLVLERNPDILEELGRRKFHQFLVGFAAETENLDENAKAKLKRKRLNLIVANDVGKSSDPVFGSDENEVFIYDNTGLVDHVSRRSKIEVARELLLLVASKLAQKRTASVPWTGPSVSVD